MTPAADIQFRRGLAALLLGMAVELGSVTLAVLSTSPAYGSSNPISGGLALIAMILGGLFVLAGALTLAFPSRPR